MAAIDITKTMQAVEQLAETLGIDLSLYGNASPTKLILEALKTSTVIIQQATQIGLTEQNPLTATELKSKIGLAALVGLNPTQLLTASIGKVLVEPNQHVCTIKQHAKLISYDNIDYYVVLPSDTIKFSTNTELVVKQGLIKTSTFVATGEAWESFILNADNYVDASSIQVFVDGQRYSVGFKLDEQAQAYVRASYDGQIEVVIHRDATIESGKSVSIEYADCIGIDGDNMQVNEIMKASDFAYEGDADISNAIQVSISEPIIGGTDFEAYSVDLANEIMLSGHNNLIGTEAQLLQYARRFKQYVIQSVKISNGVFILTALRSLSELVKSTDYWTACSMLKLRTEDILALSSHLNKFSKKSLDMLVNVEHAIQEQCRVNVVVNMTTAAPETILEIVTDYLLSRVQIGTYEVATLYKRLIANEDVIECSVSFDGNVNRFGTAHPSVKDAILVCTAANINVNGIEVKYGSYNPETIQNLNDTVDRITTERIVGINDITS